MSKTSIKNKKCDDCKEILDIKNFRRIRNYNRTYVPFLNICIECARIRSNKYRNTFKGFFNSLLCSSRSTSKKRKNKGRLDAGICDLTIDEIIEIYNKQNGRCYYSNIRMNPKPCSNWQCSLERLNDNDGYTKNNVVLVCLEFNNRTKWTNNKINELLIKIITHKNYDKILSDINTSLISKKIKRPVRKIIYKIFNNIKYWKCDVCNEYKLINEYRYREKGCKSCRYQTRKNNLKTIGGHIKQLLSHAKYHTKIRQAVKSRRQKNNIIDTFDITFEQAINILREQKGLCYYSEIEMNFGSYLDKNWVASLERIDPNKGYTVSNVCFVCIEFNTTDNRANIKYSNGGSGGWSETKFLYFLERYLRTKNKKIKRIDC